MQAFCFFLCLQVPHLQCSSDTSSPAPIEPCLLPISYSSKEALIYSLSGAHVVIRRLFLNRHFAIYFRTLKKDAFEYVPSRIFKCSIFPELLGGGMVLEISSKNLWVLILHTLIHPAAVIPIVLILTSSFRFLKVGIVQYLVVCFH